MPRQFDNNTGEMLSAIRGASYLCVIGSVGITIAAFVFSFGPWKIPSFGLVLLWAIAAIGLCAAHLIRGIVVREEAEVRQAASQRGCCDKDREQ